MAIPIDIQSINSNVEISEAHNSRNSLQRLQSFLITPVMRMESIMTFVHACLDGATLLSIHE